MHIKVISRSLDDTLPKVHGAPPPKQRNLDPTLHPLARSREYTRAVAASKLERMFAKPFVDSLDGHTDAVHCIARDTKKLSVVASGSGNGEVIVWSLSSRSPARVVRNAHNGFVRGVCFASSSNVYSSEESPKLAFQSTSKTTLDDDEDLEEDHEESENDEFAGDENTRSSSGFQNNILSCGTDKTVKLWSSKAPLNSSAPDEPLQTFMSKTAFNSIDHHRYEPSFATASDRVQVWDENRTEPLLSLLFSGSSTSQHANKDNFSGEHVISVRFSQSETSVLASAGSDRSVCLYDLRSGTATSRMTMRMRANQLSFNPMQPPILLVAGEDENLYTFDIRKFTSATQVFKGHVGAVMSCDWSPTGRSFVSGSYDRSIRLWDANHGQARDTYHTKRMQRVFSTLYSADSRFILSGSDDGNVRLWKSRASDKLGVMSTREKARRNYRDSLRQKWGGVGEVAKIERQRFLPSSIYNQQRLRRDMSEASRRRDENKRAHAPKHRRDEKPVAERKKSIIRTEE